jgi:hypothetical protein
MAASTEDAAGRGAEAMTDEPDQPEHERPLNRWDCPGIIAIGEDVLWDGEAEYLGLEPLTKIKPPSWRKTPPAKPP